MNETIHEYEIHVSVSYISGGEEYWNAFKEYASGKNATEAKRNLKDALKFYGYKKIQLRQTLRVY
jgi:N-glycosylase/DNA lyase